MVNNAYLILIYSPAYTSEYDSYGGRLEKEANDPYWNAIMCYAKSRDSAIGRVVSHFMSDLNGSFLETRKCIKSCRIIAKDIPDTYLGVGYFFDEVSVDHYKNESDEELAARVGHPYWKAAIERGLVK
jgi:hypothetical protein